MTVLHGVSEVCNSFESHFCPLVYSHDQRDADINKQNIKVLHLHKYYSLNTCSRCLKLSCLLSGMSC